MDAEALPGKKLSTALLEGSCPMSQSTLGCNPPNENHCFKTPSLSDVDLLTAFLRAPHPPHPQISILRHSASVISIQEKDNVSYRLPWLFTVPLWSVLKQNEWLSKDGTFFTYHHRIERAFYLMLGCPWNTGSFYKAPCVCVYVFLVQGHLFRTCENRKSHGDG